MKTRTMVVGRVTRWASQLRWPWLLALVAGLFVVDLVVPDFLPFVDEILLALLTLLLAAWRKRPPRDSSPSH